MGSFLCHLCGYPITRAGGGQASVYAPHHTRGTQTIGGNDWLTNEAVFQSNHQGKAKAGNVFDPSLHTAYVAGQSTPHPGPLQTLQRTYHLLRGLCTSSTAVSYRKALAGASHLPITYTPGESSPSRSQCQLPERYVYHGTGDSVHFHGRVHTSIHAPRVTA